MTIYTKLLISGTEFKDIEQIGVNDSVDSEISIASNFNCWFWNTAGLHKSDFTIGNEVQIFIGSPTANGSIFTGILEDVQFEGVAQEERINLAGRDYSARLQDVTVEPEIYTNLLAGSIVKDLMNKYVSDVTTNNVSNSNYNVTKIVFNQMNAYDAVRQLAELAGYIFYVDKNKDLHFEVAGSVSSNTTLNNTNVLEADFVEKRNSLYNAIWVYGDRYLSGFYEWMNVGSLTTGSVLTLLYKPHNSLVEWNGSPFRGGVAEMNLTPSSGTQYLIDFDNKKVIFTSGTSLGDNTPTTGSGRVIYDRDLPIVKYKQDNTSISNYGKRVKVIVDKDIKDPNMAVEIMKSELNKYKDPRTQGRLKLHDIKQLNPGNTVGIYLPNHNMSGAAFNILESDYDLNRESCQTENHLSIIVDKKVKDVTDTIKDIILDLKKIQGQDMKDSDVITRFEAGTGSFGILGSYWQVRTRGIGSSFILGHPVNGLLGSYSDHTLGDWRTGWTTQVSGGYY